jgi:parvulin-like peptidyl-prolyl isomerase
MGSPHPPPNDPAPELWCTPERLCRLDADLDSSLELLAISATLPKVLETWVRLELVEELPEEERPSQDHLEQLARKQRTSSLESSFPALPGALLHRKLQMAPGCRCWARRQWGHRLQSLYLERKDELDQAACRLLRVANKHLCLELYHRIKAGEASFEDVSQQYGEGAEREQGGLIPMRPLSELPMGLGPVLRRLPEGALTPPQKLGEVYAVVQLERYEPAALDAISEEKLLATELGNWTAAVVRHLLAHLRSKSQSSVPGP